MMMGDSILNLNSFVDHITIQRTKQLDEAILGEIKTFVTEQGMETLVILNETAILSTLKKQVPIKPIEYRYPWAICPCCYGSVYVHHIQEHIQNEETTYCEHCGQALDWSDDE